MRFPDDWPAPGMGEWLARTRLLQTEFFGGDPAELGPDEKVEFVRKMVLGLIVEATEVLGVVKSWKWWRVGNGAEFDRAHYIEELVDVVHFAGALAVMAGGTDSEWAAAYDAKTEIVKQRAREGTQ